MADSNPDYRNKYYSEQVTKQKWKEEFFNKTVQQLKTEERFVNYFKQFDPTSAESFIKHYATLKVRWFESGNDLKEWERGKSKLRMKNCFYALREIQQRKLFNAQCLWRAEKIKLPEIEICYDFRYWEDHIFGYNFISPINEEDIEFYIRYLRESPCNEPFDWNGDYQDYDEFMSQRRETGNAFSQNSWFRYYDSQEGTEWYLDLPNIRHEKEEKYLDIYRDDDRAKNPDKYNHTNSDKRAWLDRFENNFIADFVKAHESPLFYRMYLTHEKETELNELNEKVEEYLEKLEEIPLDYLAIEPADDWRTAVSLTYERYRREKVISLLPEAFEIYLKHLGREWNFPGKKEYLYGDDTYKTICKVWKEHLLKARVLNGEPADLNF